MTPDERRERAAARKLALESRRRELRLARQLRARVQAVMLERRLEAARARGDEMVARRTPQARLIYERVQRWEREHPAGRPAHRMVHQALRSGKIERPNRCDDCGLERRVEAHHEDYSRPLWVKWLCRSCHRRRHSPKRGDAAQDPPTVSGEA